MTYKSMPKLEKKKTQNKRKNFTWFKGIFLSLESKICIYHILFLPVPQASENCEVPFRWIY